MSQPLLELTELSKRYRLGSRFSAQGVRIVQAVDGVSLSIMPGETLGLVGESGCGKSTLGRCIVRLTDISSGSLRFEGEELSRKSMREMRPVRQRMQMVFQDPSASLNPRRRVRDLIAEPLRVHIHERQRRRLADGLPSCSRSSVSAPTMPCDSRTNSLAGSGSASALRAP